MKRLLFAIGLVAACAGLATSPTAVVNAQNNGQNWVTIKGRIIWAGKAPERKQIPVNVDKAACLIKGPILEEDYLVNPKNQGLANVFIWLAPKDEDAKMPIHPKLQNAKLNKAEMDQPCCMFEPRVIAIREGQEVVAKNSATVSHNIRWTGHPDFNPGGNVTLPPGKEYVLKGLKAQKLPLMVECNIHPWMRGRIGVFDHPYYAVTDADGKFEIKMAPTGDYRLYIYHESGWRGGKAGREGQPIAIKGGKDMDLGNVEFNVKK